MMDPKEATDIKMMEGKQTTHTSSSNIPCKVLGKHSSTTREDFDPPSNLDVLKPDELSSDFSGGDVAVLSPQAIGKGSKSYQLGKSADVQEAVSCDTSLSSAKSRVSGTAECVDSINCLTDIKSESSSLDHRCFFCHVPFVGGLKILHIIINRPLPKSSLDPVSLLNCFGIKIPHKQNMKHGNSLVDLCGSCYVTISECDVLYPYFCSLISKLGELWLAKVERLKMLSLNIFFEGDCHTSSLSSEKPTKLTPLILQKGKNKQHGLRKLNSPDARLNFTYVKSARAAALGELCPVVDKEENMSRICENREATGKILIDDLFTCGYCAVNFSNESEWREHSKVIHRIDDKWLTYDLQSVLKRDIINEVQKDDFSDSDCNKQLKSDSVLKCCACNGDFQGRIMLLEHLSDFHSLSVDDLVMECSCCKDNKSEIGPKKTLAVKDVSKSTVSISSCEKSQVKMAGAETNSEVLSGSIVNITSSEISGKVKAKSKRNKTIANAKKVSVPHWRCRVCGMFFSSQDDLIKHKLESHPESTRIIKRKHFSDMSSESEAESVLKDDDDDFTVKNTSSRKGGNKLSKEELGYCVVLKADGQGGVIDQRVKLDDDSNTSRDDHTNQEKSKQKQEQTSDKSLTCGMCREEFANHVLIAEHSCSGLNSASKIGSDEVILLECKICKRRLQGVNSMRTHMARAHACYEKNALRKHRCKLCSFSTQVRSEYLSHVKEKHGRDLAPPVHCELCGKKYSSQYIARHIAIIHGSSNNKKYSCKFCSMKYHDLNYLKRHIHFDHANTKWKCQICGLEFDKYHRLQLHRVNAHGTEVHKCCDCKKAFKRKGDLTAHIKRRHKAKVPSVCSICSKVYVESSNLRIHLMKKHGIAWESTLSERYARHQQESNCLKRRSAKDPRLPQANKKRGRRMPSKQSQRSASNDGVPQSSSEEKGLGQKAPLGTDCQESRQGLSEGNIATHGSVDGMQYDMVEITVVENDVGKAFINSGVERLAEVGEMENAETESCSIVIEAND